MHQQSPQGRTALVTGGGGFLGREICRQLMQAGWRVRALGRGTQPGLVAAGVDFLTGDLRDYACVQRAVSGCEAVFHVAAKAGIWGARESFFSINVGGTRNVLNACQEQRVGRLIYTSTPSVVFNGEPFEGADESLPYGRNWLCAYAESKAVAEQMALAAATDDFRVCALRPHLIWGPGDPHIIPRIIDRARSKRLRVIGDGQNRVDITHVSNAAHAHLLAAQALEAGRANGQAYFISQGEPVLLWDWIGNLLGAVGLDPPQKNISLAAAYRIGAVMETLYRLPIFSSEPPMTRFVAVEMAKSHWFDITAARRDLGYQPLLSTAEGLAAVVRELRQTIRL